MVGIPSFGNAETIGYVVRAATAGMVQYFPDLKPVLVNSDGGSPDDTPHVAVSTESPDYIEKVILVSPRHRLQRISFTYQGISGKGSAVRALFEVARELKVKAFVMVDSDLRSIVPEWIELLCGPILKGGYDFVAPMYARYKYDGTITNNIAYPLTRALYGARIRQPIGGEFAVSGDLIQRYLELTTFDASVARFGIDIWMTHSALNEGFALCQARLGAKIHDAKDPASDLGPMFRQVVGTLFRLAGVYEDRWLRVRGSHPIPEYGFERVIAPETISVNHEKLVDAFASGGAPLVIPVHDGRRGHPTLFRRSLFPELADPRLEGGARTVVHRHLEGAVEVDVDDPGTVTDIDTPEAYRAAMKGTGP